MKVRIRKRRKPVSTLSEPGRIRIEISTDLDLLSGCQACLPGESRPAARLLLGTRTATYVFKFCRRHTLLMLKDLRRGVRKGKFKPVPQWTPRKEKKR